MASTANNFCLESKKLSEISTLPVHIFSHNAKKFGLAIAPFSEKFAVNAHGCTISCTDRNRKSYINVRTTLGQQNVEVMPKTNDVIDSWYSWWILAVAVVYNMLESSIFFSSTIYMIHWQHAYDVTTTELGVVGSLMSGVNCFTGISGYVIKVTYLL